MADFKLRGQVELNFSPNKGVSAIAAQIRKELGGSIPVDLAVRGVNAQSIDPIKNKIREAVRETENLGKGMSSSIERNTQKAISSYRSFTSEIEKETKKLNKTVNLFDSFVGGISTRFAQFAKFAIASAGVQKIVQAIDYGFDAIIKINSAQIKLQQITGNTAAEVNRFSSSIIQLSRNVGVASTDLLEASDTLAQAGFGLKTIQGLMKSLANTQLVPTFGNLEKTTEGVVSAISQFRLLDVNGSTKNVDKFLSTLNTLSKKYAVEASNIIEGIKSAGGVFAASEGILSEDALGLGKSTNANKNLDTLRKFAAITTSIRSTTRLPDTVISTGLRTVINRLQDPSVEKKVQEILGANLSLRDTRGEFIGTLEAALKLNKALQDVGSNTATYIEVANAIGGGVRQAKIAIPLITGVADAYEALAEARKGDNSLAKDAELASESLSVKITKIGQDLAAFGTKIAESSGFKIMLDQIRSVTQAVTFLIDTLSPTLQIGFAAGVGSILAPKAYNVLQGTASILRGQNPSDLITRRQAGVVSAIPFMDKFLGRPPVVPSDMVDEIYNKTKRKRRTVDYGDDDDYMGYARGGYVNAMLMPGEIVFSPEEVKQIGLPNLERLNRQGLKTVPGSGNTDSFPTFLAEGSYVLNKRASNMLRGGRVRRMAKGGLFKNMMSLLTTGRKVPNIDEMNMMAAGIAAIPAAEVATKPQNRVGYAVRNGNAIGLNKKNKFYYEDNNTIPHEMAHALNIDKATVKDYGSYFQPEREKYAKRAMEDVSQIPRIEGIATFLETNKEFGKAVENLTTSITTGQSKALSKYNQALRFAADNLLKEAEQLKASGASKEKVAKAEQKFLDFYDTIEEKTLRLAEKLDPNIRGNRERITELGIRLVKEEGERRATSINANKAMGALNRDVINNEEKKRVEKALSKTGKQKESLQQQIDAIDAANPPSGKNSTFQQVRNQQQKAPLLKQLSDVEAKEQKLLNRQQFLNTYTLTRKQKTEAFRDYSAGRAQSYLDAGQLANAEDEARSASIAAQQVSDMDQGKLNMLRSQLAPIQRDANNNVIGGGNEDLRNNIAQIFKANRSELNKAGINNIKEFASAVQKGTISLSKLQGVSADTTKFFQVLSEQTKTTTISQEKAAKAAEQLSKIEDQSGTTAKRAALADDPYADVRASSSPIFNSMASLDDIRSSKNKKPGRIRGALLRAGAAIKSGVMSEKLSDSDIAEEQAALEFLSSGEGDKKTRKQARSQAKAVAKKRQGMELRRQARLQKVGIGGLAATTLGSVLASSENQYISGAGSVIANIGGGIATGSQFAGIPGAIAGGIAGAGISIFELRNQAIKRQQDLQKTQLADQITTSVKDRNYGGLQKQFDNFSRSGSANNYKETFGFDIGIPGASYDKNQLQQALLNTGQLGADLSFTTKNDVLDDTGIAIQQVKDFVNPLSGSTYTTAFSNLTGVGRGKSYSDRALERYYESRDEDIGIAKQITGDYIGKLDEQLPELTRQADVDRNEIALLRKKRFTQGSASFSVRDQERLKKAEERVGSVDKLQLQSEFFGNIGTEGVAAFDAFRSQAENQELSTDELIKKFTSREDEFDFFDPSTGKTKKIKRQRYNKYADTFDSTKKELENRNNLGLKQLDIDNQLKQSSDKVQDLTEQEFYNRKSIAPKIQAITDASSFNIANFQEQAQARRTGDLTSAGRATNIAQVLGNRGGYDQATKDKAQEQLKSVFGKGSRVAKLADEVGTVQDFGQNFNDLVQKEIGTSGRDVTSASKKVLENFISRNLENDSTKAQKLREGFSQTILGNTSTNEDVVADKLRVGDFQKVIDDTVSEDQGTVLQAAQAADQLTGQRVQLMNQYSDARLTARKNRFNPVRQSAQFRDQYASLSGATATDLAARQVDLKNQEVRNLVGVNKSTGQDYSVQELTDRKSKLEERRNELDINNKNAQQEMANLTTEIKAVDAAMNVLSTNTADAALALTKFEERLRARAVDRKGALEFALGSDQQREQIQKRQQALKALETGQINYSQLTEEERGSLSAAIENERQKDPKKAEELEKQVLLGTADARGDASLQQFQAGGNISNLSDIDRGEIKKRLEEQLANAEQSGDSRQARKARRALDKFGKATERLGVDTSGYEFEGKKISELALRTDEVAATAPEKDQLEKALKTNEEAAQYFNDQDKQVITDISNAFNSLNESVQQLGKIDFGSINFEPAIAAAQTFEKAASLLASAKVNIEGNVTVTGGGGGGANDAVLASVQSVVDKALSDFATANNMNYSKLS